jgi:MFS family permease
VLVVFYFVELHTASPLMRVDIFRIRPFLIENLVLAVAMISFVPVFFFASEYAQISLGRSASGAGLFLLFFFIGFAVAAQVGGRMLDHSGAKRPVVAGCVIAAVGFYLWAQHVTGLSFAAQQWYIILAGAGMGMMLGPASTDAVNRASRLSYGEATGITQTVRNYSASLGFAILGTVLVSRMRAEVTSSLRTMGVPARRAAIEAANIAQSQQSSGGNSVVPHFIQEDFAQSTKTVFLLMSAVMVAAALVGAFGLRRGRQEEPTDAASSVATN